MNLSECKLGLLSLYMRGKYYLHFPKKNFEENTFIFFLQNGYPFRHPGLTDRLKAIVNTYYIAKTNGLNFKIVFDYPFALTDYLIPNSVDWIIPQGQISYSWPQTKLFVYDPKNSKFKKELLKSGPIQYHCYFYYGNEYPAMQAPGNDWKKLWHSCFYELFQPSPYLEKLLSGVNVPDHYVCVHLRFVNALDNFERGASSPLNEAQKQDLIASCLDTVQDISAKSGELLLFSDSATFLRAAEKKGYHTLGTDSIGHISFDSSRAAIDKTFIDLFTMSRGDKVYSVRGKNLYNSVFPMYAAIIGDIPYETVQVNTAKSF